MENLRSKSILIADNGLFSEIASRLAQDFGEVKYFVPWANAYPRANLAHIGMGLPGVERVTTFWDHVPDADIVVFLDIYFADWQDVVVEKFHKPCWGLRRSEMLELDRWGARKLQKRLGMPTHNTKFITGIDNLANYLMKSEDKWVKISTFRGDGETWHHDIWHTSRIYLDHFQNHVGALADYYEFMVEDTVEGIEIGYDGWTVYGDYPEATYWGFEIKSEAYVGKFSPYPELPESVRYVNAKMAPLLREEHAIGFCAFEYRLTKERQPFLIDPCMRCGSPPFEVTMEGYANIAEIIWEGAHGRMAHPRSAGEYVALALIHSTLALTDWVPISCPPEMRRWLKLRNCAILDDELYYVPCGGTEAVGAVIAIGDSLEEAIRLVQERAEHVKGYSLDISVEALNEAQEEIDKAKDFGVEF